VKLSENSAKQVKRLRQPPVRPKKPNVRLEPKWKNNVELLVRPQPPNAQLRKKLNDFEKNLRHSVAT
jgi:hypothetical protein